LPRVSNARPSAAVRDRARPRRVCVAVAEPAARRDPCGGRARRGRVPRFRRANASERTGTGQRQRAMDHLPFTQRRVAPHALRPVHAGEGGAQVGRPWTSTMSHAPPPCTRVRPACSSFSRARIFFVCSRRRPSCARSSSAPRMRAARPTHGSSRNESLIRTPGLSLRSRRNFDPCLRARRHAWIIAVGARAEVPLRDFARRRRRR